MLSRIHSDIHEQERLRTRPVASTARVLLLSSTGLFLLTAILGVWVAYDRGIAVIRLITIMSGIAGTVAITLLVHNQQERWLAWLSGGSALLTVGFCLAFWTGLGLNTGVVAAGLIVLLPLESSAIVWTWRNQHQFCTGITVAACLLGLVTLVTTADHSALLGLIVGFTSTVILYWRLEEVYGMRVGYLVDGIIITALLFLGFSGWILLAFPASEELLRNTLLGDALHSRLELWRTTLPLIQDYQFTGSGLGSTALVYSTYIFLIHVPFHAHVHNLFLQIAVEQGLPGLIALIGMIGATLFGLLRSYRQAPTQLRPFYLAAWMSSIALVAYGLLDSEIYMSAGAALIFIPVGFAQLLFISQSHRSRSARSTQGRSWQQERMALAITGRWHHLQTWLVGCAPLFLLALVWFRPGAAAAQQANWGAVTQTQAELSLYRGYRWPLQDAVRREGADLTYALRYYHNALALDPNNVTAHRRLGQIMVAKGDMAAAQQHLVLAYTAAPNQLVTRQLLGEVYGVTGQIEEAVALWRTVAHDNGQLETRQWWYTYLGADTEAARLQEVIVKVSQ